MSADKQANNFPKLSKPAERALAAAGYTHLEQLAAISERDIKKLHGIGPQALAQLRRALADQGLTFADDANEQHGSP